MCAFFIHHTLPVLFSGVRLAFLEWDAYVVQVYPVNSVSYSFQERCPNMRIAVTTTGPSLDDQVEARFGRAPYYLFVDTETMEVEAVQNPNVAAGGGAGIQSAQMISDHGVQQVLTGNCGPNAFQVFSAAGIQVKVGVSGIARQAVEQFKAGAFTATNQPNVADHHGMGGVGQGRGMGMGRNRRS